MAGPRGQIQEQRSAVFGELVARLRKESRMTLKEIAAMVPMSDSNLSRIEHGKQGPPNDEAITKIAKALGADSSELLRAAGRIAGESGFEQLVRHRLDEIARDLAEIKAALAQLRPR